MRICCYFVFIGLLAFSMGCSENPPPDLLQLPPMVSMSLDLSLFGGVLVAPSLSQESAHFAAAATYMAAANQAIGLPVATPFELLKGASEVLPTIEESGVQTWDYRLDLNGTIYDVHLTAQSNESGIQWELSVSNRELDLTDFLWLEGTSNMNNRQGHWLIRAAPPSEISILADWVISEYGELEFNFERRGHDGQPQIIFLTYRRLPGPQGDTVDVMLQDVADKVIEIGWDTFSSAGYVQTLDYHQGQKSCWDAQRQDAVCE